MRQPREDLLFRLESSNKIGREQALMRDLYRDVLFDLAIATHGLIDRAHTAAAEFTDKRIRTDRLTRISMLDIKGDRAVENPVKRTVLFDQTNEFVIKGGIFLLDVR
ncbi:MAG: hypothetical protein JFAIHJKO_01486 [Pyrinomonadaceae bacterium]|nr:hypothetical protein [Pyrinomonadaceae bacterium]